MDIASQEREKFYRAGALGLRAMQDRGLGAERFTPDADARWKAFRGELADLLRFPNNQLSTMRGVGRGTAREILEVIQRPELEALRAVLPAAPSAGASAAAPPASTAAVTTELGDVPLARSLESWANAALPPVTKKQGEKPLQHVRHLWGLDELKGRHIDSVAELAATLGVTRPLIYQAVEKMRQQWKELPFLDELRSLVAGALEATGGHAPLARIGDTIALFLERPKLVSPGDIRAQALVRIAIETQDDLQLARVNKALWVVPAESDPRTLVRLGQVADELAAAEPLLSPGGALLQLRSVVAAGPLATLGDEALVGLAVAASTNAAKSARVEIYPRGLSPERALDLCLSVLPPAGLDPSQVPHILRARYPEADPVPVSSRRAGV